MKQSTLMMKIIMGSLLVGLLIYFGIYLFRSWQGGVTTVMAYTDSVRVGVEANSLVVRDEFVIYNEAAAGRTVDHIPAEGEKVSAGGLLATLYTTENGLAAKYDIQQLETEIEQLRYVLNSTGNPADNARLDSQVLDALAELRGSTAAGDLSSLEDQTLALRTLVFRRDFTYGDFTAEHINALIMDKQNQLAARRADLGSISTSVYAPRSGVFSSGVDGLEEALTSKALTWASPSMLRTLSNQFSPTGATAVCKLVASSTWYLAATVTEEEAKDFEQGLSYSVLFSRDWSGDVSMKLERISEPEDGKVLLVFSARTNLASITQLRHQVVDISTHILSGLSVPRQALRVITKTVTNEETGKEEAVEETGVYVLTGAAAEFKKVKVLWQDNERFLVEPVMDTHGDRAEAERLQPGDEIIISTSGLYDGKVVR